jgi:Na+/proline symporter
MSKAARDFAGVGGLALLGGAIYGLLPKVFANKMNERRREAARAARVWAWIWVVCGTACLVVALVLLLVDQAS